uniref:Myb-like domain-containing protein n=1 Tax=Brassica oleracea var. oleracea TaxID=109376 RepID=A0A0D3D8B5_BRAOL
MDSFSFNSPGLVNLLASQSSQTIELGSSEVPKPASKRKWTTKEDVVLISAWLNTSKDPIVSNEQKTAKFWKRIEEYVNASPLLIGSVPRDWSQCHGLHEVDVCGCGCLFFISVSLGFRSRVVGGGCL